MSRSALTLSPLWLLLACAGDPATTDKSTVPTDEPDSDTDSDSSTSGR